MDGYAIDGRLSTSLEETIPSVNAHMWHSDHFAFLRLLMCYARLRLSGIVHKRDCIWAKFTSGKVDKMVVTDRHSGPSASFAFRMCSCRGDRGSSYTARPHTTKGYEAPRRREITFRTCLYSPMADDFTQDTWLHQMPTAQTCILVHGG
jgi:hypothetical protein